jgi:hypothetical protein
VTTFISRRGLLQLTLGAGASMAAGARCGVDSAERRRTAGREYRTSFDRRLVIPPLLRPTVDDRETLVFDLTARAGRREFVTGRQTGSSEFRWG